MTAAVDELIARLADAERRLGEHASRPLPPGLTEPDPGGEERWEAGQVWAHLAEFPAYWLAQAQRVVWVGSWTTAISRKVTIRVAGTTGRPRIDLDALVTAN